MATAFAIFCADDGSLTFYKRDTVPSVGDEFEGKVVGAVYEGFESTVYLTSSYVPWVNNMSGIKEVSFNDEIAPVSTAFWFRNASNMTSFNAVNLNTSNVAGSAQYGGMYSMFENCSSLTGLDLSSFNTSNVMTMYGMFYKCSNLTSLNLNFNTSNVVDMSYMFSGCNSLTSLDLSSFNTSNVTSMQSMFSGGSVLMTIYVSDLWSTAVVTESASMFWNCTSLVGNIPFDSNYKDATHANYQTGYLTYKFYADYLKNRFVIDGAELNRLADAIRDKTGTLAGLSFPDGFIAAIESISVVATDDENGNVVMSIAGLSSTNSNGDVVIK